MNVSIPNCNNETEGIKLFFQHVIGYHLFHSGIHYYVIGIFYLKLGTIFFQTWEEFLNVSIPNCNNKTEGIKLFFQHVTGYHLFHSGIYYYVIGIFYLYKQNTCFFFLII